ncbi:GNAT family N-acetyltransferase [Oscillochloris sp. ZM17-4]|uniref:GNAT family N-acetyltransferase n=1 Tax=Oscillochloris sp. ZM17-4 TaxID=2866714 RepID=UPI001C738520|nr:GNAT family N-acetyltransferase [Oscillochloris sp. ZM17-4]MBX0330236.1 GNAT family N-acetyltransferase [Oscillochloris sp. ZM17-4]
MSVTITPERPDTPDAMALVIELDELLLPLYPAESHHGLDVDSLIAEGVDFFVLRVGGEPAGCGGVKLYGAEYGEVKRMFVRPQFRGRGLSKRMLGHLEAFTREQGAPLLRLETGVLQREAIALYERMGYVEVGPFGDYRLDPHSLFYEKRLG